MTAVASDTHFTVPGFETHFLHPEGAGAGDGPIRYLKGGSGAPVVLLHTVRTQAEHFHRLMPLLAPHHTVYAMDLPGMGRSEIVAGASFEEPSLRRGVRRFIKDLDLLDVTLLGESLGGVLALTVAAEETERVRRVVAVNPYDYRGGILRSSLIARLIVGGIITPGVGRLLSTMEPKPIIRAILTGGLVDRSALTDRYLDELLAAGQRPGHAAAARAVYRTMPSLIRAREHYKAVEAEVHLVYGAKDWSRRSDREANRLALPHARFTEIADAGHFLSLERPQQIADLAVARRAT